MKASEVIEALKKDWRRDWEMVWIKEFRPSMGWNGEQRRLDLWGMHLSPAKGMHAHSFEVKVSRSDWLVELKQPLKRRMALAISNFFWLATPKGIIKPEELPPQTGLIEIDLKAKEHWNICSQIHPADYRDKVRPTWAFVASALKNYSKETP